MADKPFAMNATTKAMLSVAGFIITMSAAGSIVYAQMVKKFDEDFMTDKAHQEDIKSIVDSVDKISQNVDKNTKAIESLREVTTSNTLNNVKRDIADIKQKMADLEMDRPNWSNRDRAYYNTLGGILEDLEQEKSNLESM